MKRILITGATGFIGANLTRRLLREGHAVHLLLRPGAAYWRIEAIRADLRLHEAQLHDLAEVTRVVGGIRPDWIFHLAADGAYAHQIDLDQMVRTNFDGTINLVRACLQTGFEVFVNSGSSSEYGYKDHAPGEDEIADPNSYYAVTKLAATQFCRYAARAHGMPIPTLRLYSVYGPYEDPRRLMPTLLIHALAKRWPPLVSPETAHDFIFIDDVADAFLAVATARLADPGAVYNLGTGVQTTLGELVTLVADLFGVEARPQWGTMAVRSWDTSVWVANSLRLQSEVGWYPRVNLSAGVAALRSWFETHPDWLAFYRKAIGC